MSREFDQEIDTLLRKGARRAAASSDATRAFEGDAAHASVGAHLDADEQNAYAENALPASVRTHYAAHLADCDDCRRSVTQLALAAGIAAQLERGGAAAKAAGVVATKVSWGERIGALLAPRAWRYAVPALALLLVGSVALLVFMRGKPEREVSIAKNGTSQAARPAITETPLHHAPPDGNANGATANVNKNGASTAPDASGKESAEGLAANSAEAQPQGSQFTTLADASTPTPPSPPPAAAGSGESRTVAPAEMVALPKPEATPAPVAEPLQRVSEQEAKAKVSERAEEVSKDVQNLGNIESRQREKLSGPRRSNNSEQRNMRTLNSDDTGERADKAGNSDRDARTGATAAAPPAAAAASRAPRSRTRDAERDENRPADNNSAKGEGARKQEAAAETRTVAGRKFRRQGDAWVDTAYQPSQAVTVVRRNTEQYRALVADEPTLRRIADALGGEVTVVWKGRPYRIR